MAKPPPTLRLRGLRRARGRRTPEFYTTYAELYSTSVERREPDSVLKARPFRLLQTPNTKILLGFSRTQFSPYT